MPQVAIPFISLNHPGLLKLVYLALFINIGLLIQMRLAGAESHLCKTIKLTHLQINLLDGIRRVIVFLHYKNNFYGFPYGNMH